MFFPGMRSLMKMGYVGNVGLLIDTARKTDLVVKYHLVKP